MPDDAASRSRRRFDLAGDRLAQGRLARGRLRRIVGAYLTACLAAALLLPIGFLVGDLVAGRMLTIHASDWLLLPAGLFLVSVIAAAPFATLAIVLAEGYRFAALLPYLVAGGLIGFAADVVVNHLPIARPEAQPADVFVYILVAAIGGVSGLVYWLIAVRHRQIAER
ncbi:MAG: hypothetical protein P4L98_23900 [Ancalomicrobiaceae bacterium]|nr:hypothetical protein [Ancalomicrobiaceae bacterium]